MAGTSGPEPDSHGVRAEAPTSAGAATALAGGPGVVDAVGAGSGGWPPPPVWAGPAGGPVNTGAPAGSGADAVGVVAVGDGVGEAARILVAAVIAATWSGPGNGAYPSGKVPGEVPGRWPSVATRSTNSAYDARADASRAAGAVTAYEILVSG